MLLADVEMQLLQEAVIILGLSVLVIYLFQKLKIPSILGFLATGILFGPEGFGLVTASEEVEVLSEIGIIFLLFIIGLEFSIKNLLSIKKVVFIGGLLQVGLTIAITFGCSYLLGIGIKESVFIGFLFSLSSTAIVLKILQEKGHVKSPHGRITLGILIFQDIIVVPMMLFTPILSGHTDNVGYEVLVLLLKAIFVVVLVYVSARFLVPRLLHEIARTRNRELFLITIIVICFAVAFITSNLGLSISLGAFMAGLTISESEYSHQATGLIIPFREIFTSFFFVSIGMLLDLNFLFEHLAMVLVLLLVAFLVKFNVLVFTTMLLRFPIRTALLVGFSLFQVGEFAFILADVGMENNLLGYNNYQYFLSISILSMALTPFVVEYSENLTALFLLTPFKNIKYMERVPQDDKDTPGLDEMTDHLVIIGYGLNGKNTAKAAKKANLPYVIVDLNAEAIREAKTNNEPIIFGDAMNAYILNHVNVFRARVVVVAVTDAFATKKIVSNIRSISSNAHVIVRCRSIVEADELFNLGASEVVAEEFETSVEIFARTLNQFLIREDKIDNYIDIIRSDSYQRLKSKYHFIAQKPVDLSSVVTQGVEVKPDSILLKKKLSHLDKAEDFRVKLIGVLRDGKMIINRDMDQALKEGDKVYLLGKEENIKKFLSSF